MKEEALWYVKRFSCYYGPQKPVFAPITSFLSQFFPNPRQKALISEIFDRFQPL
jgi:hypothetical protein